MPHELKIPEVGESVQEVQIGQWLVEEGEYVEKDQAVVEIDTDKASLEIYAPVSGVLTKVAKSAGESAEVGEVVGTVDESAEPSGGDGEAKDSEKASGKKASKKDKADAETTREKAANEEASQESKSKKDRAAEDEADAEAEDEQQDEKEQRAESEESRVMPAARRLLDEHELSAEDVPASGPGGRLTKQDVVEYLENGSQRSSGASEKEAEPAAKRQATGKESTSSSQSNAKSDEGHRRTERVRMSLIRRRIAARLVEAQQQAALLTTVNEIDMTEVMELRKKYRDPFQKKYDIKLGFMSFFVKGVIEGLKEFPALNAQVQGDEIVYHNYFDIGIAIGGGKGLVVPVLRNAERQSFAEIELTIDDLAKRAQANKIGPDELEGGTFTITNGGIYGSLLSSPIVNPPQSGVLGMHQIQERPVARNGEIVIRPMMYVALTYDHRIVDGREAVTFLRRVKETLEDPARMLLEV